MTIEMITSNPWFSLVGLIVTTVSLVVAFIFYRKSRRDKIPCYSVTKQTVIENSAPILPGLSVQFNGVVQKVITVAKVAFWNHGTETIMRQDIADAKPLTIIIDEGVKVLNATVLKRTDLANQFEIGEPQKQENGTISVPISFDFLDRGDGALVQVVHNGEEKTMVWVEGRIKGSHNPLRQSSFMPDQRWIRKMSQRSFMAVCLSLYLVFGIVLIIGVIRELAIAFGVLFVLISFLGYLGIMGVRKVPAAINPVDEDIPLTKA